MKVNINVEDENPDGSGGLFVDIIGDTTNIPFLAIAVNAIVSVISQKTGISPDDVYDVIKKNKI